MIDDPVGPTAGAPDELVIVRPIEPIAYRPKDACVALGIGKTKLYELLKDGRLKSEKVDNCRLVTGKSVRALVHKD